MTTHGIGWRAIATVVIIVLVAFALGWFIKGRRDNVVQPQSLRLSGYTFIDPLLACNINNSNAYAQNKLLSQELQSIIDTAKNNGTISKASVYFVNFKTGAWANVYGDELFYPSSLGKIPLMIAYYQESENDPSILTQELAYPVGSTDLNQMQDIAPAKAIVPGQSYTVEQLIEYMIKYSDNNATALLDANINQDTLARVYGDLDIPSEDNVNIANADFVTAHQVATMFRVLYNATYLWRSNSEKALQLLSQSSFTQGLVAGVASTTVVSHKLGLVGIAPNGVTTEHELHDCGIVYAKVPYLICVMTRGAGSLPNMESVIAQLSKAAYQSVQNSK
ncbi:MAG: serine hydrolase [Minisyncoccia bacterium]|jgi:beta-lactamase class A